MCFPLPFRYLLALAVVFATTFPTTTFAQQDQALARAQYLLRQVNAEKSQLQSQLAEQTAEIESLKKEVSALEKKLTATASRSRNNAEQYQQNLDNFRQALAKERTDVSNLQTALQQSLNRAASLDQGLNTCLDNNRQYYELSQSLIDSYKSKGFMDVFKSREALTGFGKVWLENQAQEFANRTDDLELRRSDVAQDNAGQ